MTTTSTITTTLRAAGCVFADEEAALLVASTSDSRRLAHMVQQRVAGLPLEHILGWAQFAGMRVSVDPGVFVPRRRTELLARHASQLTAKGDTILELCCGSAAVSVAVASAHPDIAVHAVDIDPAATACARRNLAGSNARIYDGDLYQPLPHALENAINVLVANAPYVPSGAMELLPPEARLHEARVALDGGVDGVDIQRRILRDAALWLAPGGFILIETSDCLVASTQELFVSNRMRPHAIHEPELDGTVVFARIPG
ncbi:MAG: putative protein N(5)-glutamine methyltransferase [Corynebacteriales bacterium]|nr:putative protein N(5)-glutamine methyltransferase [Mycobacteriales bacterium]